MAEPLVRRMTPMDIDSVYHIELSSFAAPWSRADLSHEINSNAVARYLVIEEAGEVVGFAGAHIILDEAHIINVAVSRECRSKGYGRLLGKALMQYAANLGVRYTTLEVRRSNVAAIRLYTSLGFVTVSTRKKYYEDNHEDALLMVCDSMPPAQADFTEPETLIG